MNTNDKFKADAMGFWDETGELQGTKMIYELEGGILGQPMGWPS